MEMSVVTVAVCTRNRPARLRRALGSLVEQTVPPTEILVVDNAPRDESTRALIIADFPDVRYVREEVQGLDFARNRALVEARGEVVAFLDDDAVADPTWVEILEEVFGADPGIGACTGRVDALSLESPAQRMFEANGGYARGTERVRLPRDASAPLHGRRAPLIAWAVSIGSGCSFAVRRDLALGIGGFDEALDMGSALPGGGDHDMLWRVLQAGAAVVYEPRAHAWHEHRRDRGGAHDQIVGHQRALIALLTKTLVDARGRERLPILAFLGWRLLKPGARIVRRIAGRDPLPTRLLLRMWLECWKGLGSYSAARKLVRRRKAAAAGPATMEGARPEMRAGAGPST